MSQEINPTEFQVIEHEGKEYLAFKVSYNDGAYTEVKAIKLSRIDQATLEAKYYVKRHE